MSLVLLSIYLLTAMYLCSETTFHIWQVSQNKTAVGKLQLPVYDYAKVFAGIRVLHIVSNTGASKALVAKTPAAVHCVQLAHSNLKLFPPSNQKEFFGWCKNSKVGCKSRRRMHIMLYQVTLLSAVRGDWAGSGEYLSQPNRFSCILHRHKSYFLYRKTSSTKHLMNDRREICFLTVNQSLLQWENSELSLNSL